MFRSDHGAQPCLQWLVEKYSTPSAKTESAFEVPPALKVRVAPKLQMHEYIHHLLKSFRHTNHTHNIYIYICVLQIDVLATCIWSLVELQQ